jgi:tRNA-dihydrouridine synthase B
VDIPVIASGDVRSLTDVEDYFDRGASGVMVGRAMMGDPFFISRMISGRAGPFPSTIGDIERIFSIAGKHLDLSIGFYGEKRGCMKFRSQLGWYVRSFKGRKPYMDRIHHASAREDFTGLMDEILYEWKRQPGTC